jgi:hypothetical protein
VVGQVSKQDCCLLWDQSFLSVRLKKDDGQRSSQHRLSGLTSRENETEQGKESWTPEK